MGRPSELSDEIQVQIDPMPAELNCQICGFRGQFRKPKGFSNQAVVGWPPLRAFRMNCLVNLSKAEPDNDTPRKANQKGCSIGFSNGQSCKGQEKSRLSSGCLFVKVNLDGDPIGRKVDLNSHCSYEGLAISLELMFWGTTTSSTSYMKSSRLLDSSSELVLTYKDKDGDWLLVGDVPWSLFLDTAKWLRIMRNFDANMLSTRQW